MAEKATTLMICSRCLEQVLGMDLPHGTAGFYRVSTGIWAEYKLPGETILCDACMCNDPRYQRDYPQETTDAG
jgi:hypothetical protein